MHIFIRSWRSDLSRAPPLPSGGGTTSSGVVFIMNTILVYLKDRSKKVVYLDFIQSLEIHKDRFGDPRNRIHYEYCAGLECGRLVWGSRFGCWGLEVPNPSAHRTMVVWAEA